MSGTDKDKTTPAGDEQQPTQDETTQATQDETKGQAVDIEVLREQLKKELLAELKAEEKKAAKKAAASGNATDEAKRPNRDEELVDVFLQEPVDDKDDQEVRVIVNGRVLRLQKGKHHKIPRKYALALQNSQRQNAAAFRIIKGFQDGNNFIADIVK